MTAASTSLESSLQLRQPGLEPKAPVSDCSEALARQPRGKPLHGDFYQSGVSIEWHDFELAQRFEWSRGFRPGSLEVCLNLEGYGLIQCGRNSLEMAPFTAAVYLNGRQVLQAWREAGIRHRFVTVGFSAGFLKEHLAPSDGALNPLVESFARGNSPHSPFDDRRELLGRHEQFVRHLLNPPVPQGARALWYQGKLLEIMAEFFFGRRKDDELFCDRQKRLARERVDKVVALLRTNLVKPLSLEELAQRVGCSAFHLSRTFSREAGMSIPQYLRRVRMESAAELLKSGKYNVTEAALEVGYSSLSHFSQAFCQTMGCCPGLYPLSKAEPRPAPARGNSQQNQPHSCRSRAWLRTLHEPIWDRRRVGANLKFAFCNSQFAISKGRMNRCGRSVVPFGTQPSPQATQRWKRWAIFSCPCRDKHCGRRSYVRRLRW